MSVQSRDPNGETITINKEGRWYIARDHSSGIASQGETKAGALENLADALELHGRAVPDIDTETEPSTAPWHSG